MKFSLSEIKKGPLGGAVGLALIYFSLTQIQGKFEFIQYLLTIPAFNTGFGALFILLLIWSFLK